MQITPPYGYGSIVALEKRHKVLLPDLPSSGGGTVPDFASRMNAMGISGAEFAAAGRDYPIVFVRSPEARYLPVAVLGVSDGSNLYVADGHWTAGNYVPAFLRRYPFCPSQVTLDGVVQENKLVCIDRAYIDESGVALFAADGTPLPRWAERQRLLEEYEKDLEWTAQMCAGLEGLGLFVPFSFQVTAGVHTWVLLQGMQRIDETKFLALPGDSHKDLAEKGWAARVYAHFFSLANFARLVERAQSRAAAAEEKRRAERRARSA